MGIAMEHEGLPLTRSTSSISTGGADAIHQQQQQQQHQQQPHHHQVSSNKPQLRTEGSRSFHSATAEHDEEAAVIRSKQQPQHHDAHPSASDLEGSDSDSSDDQQKPFLADTSSSGDGDASSSDNHDTPTSFCGYAKLLRDDIFDYIHLLRSNRAFRLFLVSYVFGHMGEWFTYIASISLMERMLGENNEHSRTSIGVLVMIRLLPTVLLSPFGGVLADSRDRRKSMIILDLVGACTPVLFILATFLEHSTNSVYGVAMIYFATVCQECVCALYEPCRTSIVPLLVTGNDGDLKKATTLTGVAWSAVAAFGSALGGFTTSYFGARTCFCLDGCCYLISAILMWSVGGNWVVAPETQYESVWQQIKGMTIDGAQYLSSSFFGGLIFFKASCALVTGATNVLNVSLSERQGDMEGLGWVLGGMDTEQKLGLLFSITGIGCILGPLVADPLTNVEHPRALQLACIYGFVAVTVGCFGVGLFHPFWSVCLFSAIRSAGMGILWLDSQFLLQKFSAKEMLGRVAAVDEALATLAEALSSLLCGVMQDRVNLSAARVSEAQAFLGFVFVIAWSMYHAAGRGAACRTSSGAMVPMKKSSYSGDEGVGDIALEPIINEVTMPSRDNSTAAKEGWLKRRSPQKPKSIRKIHPSRNIREPKLAELVIDAGRLRGLR